LTTPKGCGGPLLRVSPLSCDGDPTRRIVFLTFPAHLCGAGTFSAGVALRGTVVKFKPGAAKKK
jgi:hypothetical protein